MRTKEANGGAQPFQEGKSSDGDKNTLGGIAAYIQTS